MSQGSPSRLEKGGITRRTLAWCGARWVWAALLLMLAAVYALPYLLAPANTYASPDESATAFFAREVAERSRLAVPWPVNEGVDALVHPRSMRVVGGNLVPGGFATLPALYGAVAGVLGLWALPWLTPLLAAAGAWWWGRVVAALSGSRRAGIVAGVLLALHPAWWFWASRGFMGNVPFVALLLGAASLWLRGAKWSAVGGGALLALALAIRPGELYWVLLGGAVVLAGYWHQVPWQRLALAVAGAGIAAVPCVAVHVGVFGWGFGGYGTTLGQLGLEVPHGLGDRLLGPLRPWLFPLGFAPRTALSNAVTYGLGFFWWWTALVTAALAWLAWRRQLLVTRAGKTLAVASVVVIAWLVAFYGSFLIGDNSAGDVTIGVSYFRYWLPAFVLSTVPVALAVDRLLRAATTARRRAGVGVAAGAVLALSVIAVTCSPAEGLVPGARVLERSARARAFVVARTPADAIVVVDRADKFLFPARTVLQPLRSAHTYAAICQLYPQRPLYYFGVTLPPADLAHVRDVQLSSCGLAFVPVAAFGGETLYRVTRAAGAVVAVAF